MKELAEQRLLSAPVVLSASVEDQDADTYMGMVDVSAILRTIIESIHRDEEASPSTSGSKWDRFQSLGKDIEKRTLITMMNNDVQLEYRGEAHEDLLTVIRDGFLGLGRDHPNEVCHRMAIFNPRGHIIHIISQSDVVGFLAQHSLGALGKKTVAELGLVTGAVVCVPHTTIAADAFSALYEKKVSGVAIVDDQGVLVGNVSASDLRTMHRGHFPRLLWNVMDFLRSEHAHATAAGDVIAVGEDATFEDALKRLVHNKIHRIYIVDKQKHPVGVCTLTDVLELVSIECEQQEGKAKDGAASTVPAAST